MEKQYKFRTDSCDPDSEIEITLIDDHETYNFIYPTIGEHGWHTWDIDALKEMYGKKVIFHCYYFDTTIDTDIDELVKITKSGGIETGQGGFDNDDVRAIAWRKDGKEPSARDEYSFEPRDGQKYDPHWSCGKRKGDTWQGHPSSARGYEGEGR